MALSSGPRSNSSASKASKPTYRRASAAGKGPASNKTGARPKPKAPRKAAPKAPAPARSVRASKPAPKPATAVKSPKKAAPSLGARGASTLKAPKVSSAKPPVRAAKPYAQPTPKTSLKSSKPVAMSGIAGASKVSQASKVVAPKPSMPKAAVGTKGKAALPGFLKPFAAVFGTAARALGGLFAHIPLPHLSRGVVLAGVGGVVGLVLVALVVANSGLFAATEIEVRGSAHVEQQTAEKLVKIPDGTTLLNVDESAILETLKASPWVAGVDIQREWPHKLTITPVEHTVKAIAYITADEIAWGISEEGTWIAPLSLTIAVDAEGNIVSLNDDGSVPEGATQLAPADAALRLAQEAGALMLTDVPSDANPKSGEPVSSEVVLAGLEYAKSFSPEFVSQIKDLSVASIESIAAYLTSGIEVSLGSPENITEKERVVTKLLEQQDGVTYINVREPGAYTFRSAPQES